ncbi:MAG: hypothetical protein OEW19_16290 [Acidobacteriota bacterium]|nr:hypothetical protein [Acidobacteriota bacterium]
MTLPGRRVVVTGVGRLASIGTGREAFWRARLAGRSGISPVESFGTRRYVLHLGGGVKDFSPGPLVTRLPRDTASRTLQMAMAAAHLAPADAGVPDDGRPPRRTGWCWERRQAGPRTSNDSTRRRLPATRRASATRRYPCHGLAANVAAELGMAGPNLVIPTACAAGNYAVAQAFDTLGSGAADVMLAGGSDGFSRITSTGFARLGAIAPERCQPFDRSPACA